MQGTWCDALFVQAVADCKNVAIILIITRNCSKHCLRVLNTRLCRAVYRIRCLNENKQDSMRLRFI